MDNAIDAKAEPAGISIRNGPVEDKMDVDEPATNGTAKRKSRGSTSKAVNYNQQGSESEDDDVPLVCNTTTPLPSFEAGEFYEHSTDEL